MRMPTIKLLPKKPKNNNHKQTDKRKLRQKAYNSTKWRKLRDKYLKEHPMCEICGKNPTQDIHHLKSFIVRDEIDWELFLDENNLEGLCKECHGKIHSGKIKQDKNFIEEDDNSQYNIILL